jgi:hypothetical protein
MAAAYQLPEEPLRIKENIERRMGELQLSGPTVAGLAGIPLTTWYRGYADPDEFSVRNLRKVAGALDSTLARAGVVMSIPNAEAIARAACPRCEQPISEPCRYLPPPHDWASNRKQTERAGKPMAAVHQERRYVVFELRRNEPHSLSPGKAGRYEVRLLANLFDGEWYDEEDMWGAKWSGLDPARERCYQAGWIEFGERGWSWRITDAGVAALKERS